MVARSKNHDEDIDEPEDELDPDRYEGIHFVTEEEAWDFFDDQALRTLGISGEEFLRRWDNGEYSQVPDTPEGWPIGRLIMLIPIGRPRQP